MSTFSIAGPFTKAAYRNNPNFLGEWTDRTQVFERKMKIVRHDAVTNDYKYGVYVKTIFHETGKSRGFIPMYLGSLEGNALKVKTEKRSTNRFYILKDGRLTDNDIYLMQKVR